MLIEECNNVSEIIEFAVEFHVNDEMLWNSILQKASQSTSTVNELLEYVDFYNNPKLIIDAYGSHVTIGDVRVHLTNAFKKIYLY